MRMFFTSAAVVLCIALGEIRADDLKAASSDASPAGEASDAGTSTQSTRRAMLQWHQAAGLALFAPKRYSEADRSGIDSVFIHRALAIVHAAAMLRLAYLGPRMEKGGVGAVRQMKDTGWAGFAALGASFVVMAF